MEDDFESAAVVGLGLIGGSLARDFAARGVHVRAYDADPQHLAAALREGFVADALDATLSGVRDAELIIVAVPVDAAIEVLRRIAPFAANAKLITDVGSTKARSSRRPASFGLLHRSSGRIHWPATIARAGTHRGPDCSWRRGLRLSAVRNAGGVVELAARVSGASWAQSGVMRADDHDRQLAWTSHLPHMVSTALALALARTGVERGDLGPGGRDVTRLGRRLAGCLDGDRARQRGRTRCRTRDRRARAR